MFILATGTAQDDDSLRMRGLLPASTAHAWSQLGQKSGRLSGSAGYRISGRIPDIKKWPDFRHIPSTGTPLPVPTNYLCSNCSNESVRNAAAQAAAQGVRSTFAPPSAPVGDIPVLVYLHQACRAAPSWRLILLIFPASGSGSHLKEVALAK